MEFGRFRFRDHLENGEQFESETSSELSSVSSGGGDESEPDSMTGKVLIKSIEIFLTVFYKFKP